jgi:hypothetical protein
MSWQAGLRLRDNSIDLIFMLVQLRCQRFALVPSHDSDPAISSKPNPTYAQEHVSFVNFRSTNASLFAFTNTITVISVHGHGICVSPAISHNMPPI